MDADWLGGDAGYGAAGSEDAAPHAAGDVVAPASNSDAAAAADHAYRRNSWGLSPSEVSLHKQRLLAFYTVNAPAKATPASVDSVWGLFGPRVWEQLEVKYRGRTVGFAPVPAAP